MTLLFFNQMCGQVLVLQSPRLLCPAADNNFAICQNARVGRCFLLPSQFLGCPGADDAFVICQNAVVSRSFCCQASN